MMYKKFIGVLRISGSLVIISGSGWFVYQICKTRYILSHTVNTDVIYHRKKSEYIYINDPQFHMMYGKKQMYGEEQKQQSSRLPAIFGFWKSLKRSYVRRLLSLAQAEDRSDRLKAVELLSKLKNLKEWDYRHAAQMCDARTAVGLARTEGADLRFFLKPPYCHLNPSKEELTDRLCNLLISLNSLKRHPCINFFLAKAFPELQHRHIVFDADLATMQLPQIPIKKDDVLPLSIENLLHYSTIDDNAKDIVKLGGLPLIVDLCRYFEDNIDINIMLVNLLCNISVQDDMLQDFFTTGCIGLLARWSKHSNIRLAVPAARALANIDVDDIPNVKFSHRLHLLHPTVRRIDVPKLDVVFIHGLLGGVFITWRQRDRDHNNLSILEGVTGFDDGKYMDSDVSDEQTKQYLQDMAEFKQDEWDNLGSDFEMVLSDCPEESNSKGKGPYSYSGRNLDFRSTELMQKLKQAGLGSRPIVWVAHSMGGLIVKSMLIKAMQDEDEQVQGLCRNTKAVVFYSVPHRGSPLVSLTQATQLLWWPSVEVQELKENSPALLTLHSQFLDLVEKKNIEIISFAETKPTLLSSLHLQFHFVPKESADPGIGEFFEIPQDHLCICKPNSRQSFLYQKLIHLIQKYIPTNE
ncbi:protein SERAC1 isoform X3 [Periplaneta americana]|uniref:protein SERAC1 isoform X3 n=1 Tax=Periplaneta americana TaxID=6978 RepID=UPI0037E770DA